MRIARKSGVYKDSWKWSGMMMSLPAILTVLVFIFIPLAMNLGYSFTDYTVSSIVPRFIGFTNFINIINDPDFGLVCINTIKLAVIYVVGLNTLAIFISVLIARVGRKFGNLVKTILYFSCLLAMVVVGFIWRVLFNYSNGIINKVLSFVLPKGMIPEWLGDPSYIMLSIGITVIWFALGYYVVIYYAGLMSIPTDLYEVSNIEGANSWQEFRYVTLPLLAPSITINVVLTTMAIIASFDLPYTLTNGGGPGKYGTTIPIWIYQMYFLNFQYGKSIALSCFLAVIAIIVAIIELKILLKKEVET